MTRSIKTLGLALVAVLAMGALVASAAQAAPTLEIEGGGEAELMGTQVGTQVFSVDGSSVECEVANFEPVGQTTSGATWGRLHPVYSECTAFGFVGATVTTTGCDYEAMATGTATEIGGMKNYASGEIKVVCETGKTITISGGGCKATVGSQTISSGIEFTNTAHETAPKMDVDIITHEAPVATTKTEDGIFCPFNGTGATTGKITGTTTIDATRPKGTTIGVTAVG
jgi:hypothetical protein